MNWVEFSAGAAIIIISIRTISSLPCCILHHLEFEKSFYPIMQFYSKYQPDSIQSNPDQTENCFHKSLKWVCKVCSNMSVLISMISIDFNGTRGYQKVLSLTWKEPEIWIYSALFFNVVPFQLHTLVPSSYPVINTRSVEVNILVP